MQRDNLHGYLSLKVLDGCRCYAITPGTYLGDNNGYLGWRQIARIQRHAQTLGVKILWAGGLSLRDAFEMGKLGYRKREPNEPQREQPRLLNAMVSYHIRKLGYSVGEMAEMLHLLPAEFEQMYAPAAISPACAP